MIIPCMGNNVENLVGHRHHLIAEIMHFLRIGETVAPDDHLNVVNLDRLLAFGMGERPPYHGLFTVFLGKAGIAVGKIAEFFDNDGVAV